MGGRCARAWRERKELHRAVKASRAEQALAPGWEQRYDLEGYSYFVDHARHTTTYQDPRTKKKSRKWKSPPPYVEDFHGKCERLHARLRHKFQQAAASTAKLELTVSRESALDDSVLLISRCEAWEAAQPLHIHFVGEEGLDFGGMAREWFVLVSTQLVEGSQSLFSKTSENTYRYFLDPQKIGALESTLRTAKARFLGRFLGLALLHRGRLEALFATPFYKQLVAPDSEVELDDIRESDPQYYQSLRWLLDNDLSSLDPPLFFVYSGGGQDEVELVPHGSTTAVTNANKHEFVRQSLQHKYVQSVAEFLGGVRDGLHELVGSEELGEFDAHELERVLHGHTAVDVGDWRRHTEYVNMQADCRTATWFWETVELLDPPLLAKLLQFATGSPSLPVGGFAALYGAAGPQWFTLAQLERWGGLPSAHACFNRLELPYYSSREELHQQLVTAITETVGFGIE